MNYEKPESLTEARREAAAAYSPIRLEMKRKQMVNMCMYAGCQWLYRGDSMTYSSNYLARIPSQWTADGNKLRATVNRTNRFAQKVAAATFPDKIEMEVSPPDRDTGIPATVAAQVMESMANLAVDKSAMINSWRKANFMRVINGAWGVGLSLTNLSAREIMGQQMPDQRFRCFDFDYSNLILDASLLNRPLNEHDEIEFVDIWTAAKLKRVLPDLKFDEQKLRTVGQLDDTYVNINRLSSGRLYSSYASFSNTKGVRIRQYHCRGVGERFDRMYIGVELQGNENEVTWVNFDNPVSPFGGNGLPFMILHGHFDGDGFGFLSDVHMMKDDQDRLNLTETFRQRMLRNNAGFQWLLPQGSQPRGTDAEGYNRQFHNTVGGLIPYDPGTRDAPKPAPQLVKYPDVPAYVEAMIVSAEESMRKQTHRSDANFGVTQTHVPNSSFQRALEEADQVHGQRVRTDLDAAAPFIGMMLGTSISMAQRGVPWMLGAMREEGMDQQDIGVVLQADPEYPPCGLAVRESTVRYRSHDAKQADLDKDLQLQAIDPFEYRMARARDLDSPLTENDKFYVQQAGKAAFAVLMGMEWEPLALGIYSSVFVDEFRKAQLDKRAIADQNTSQRLKRAIVAQLSAGAAEQALVATIAQPQVGVDPASQQPVPTDSSTEGGEAEPIDGILAAIEQGRAA